MRAVVITEPGTPDVLGLRDVPTPEPSAGQIRVRVEAAGINRADLLQRQGHYAAPEGWPADIPGLEYAGSVDAVGDGVSAWSPGDRVMGLTGGGSYAEYVVVAADQVLPVPARIDLTTAAAVPKVFITAHDALHTRLGLRSGETLLIHAVGSGVGTAALQLAKARDCRVIGTARTGWKLDRARELGLDVAIDASGDDDDDRSGPGDTTVRAAARPWAEVVREATDGKGVDAILDLVGGAYLAGNLRSLRTLGRQVVVGLTAGRTAEIDLGTLLSKRLTLVGTALRTRSPAEKAETTRAFRDDALPLLAVGTIRPVIHEVLSLAEAARAHELLESNRTFGKVLLRVANP